MISRRFWDSPRNMSISRSFRWAVSKVLASCLALRTCAPFPPVSVPNQPTHFTRRVSLRACPLRREACLRFSKQPGDERLCDNSRGEMTQALPVSSCARQTLRHAGAADVSTDSTPRPRRLYASAGSSIRPALARASRIGPSCVADVGGIGARGRPAGRPCRSIQNLTLAGRLSPLMAFQIGNSF